MGAVVATRVHVQASRVGPTTDAYAAVARHVTEGTKAAGFSPTASATRQVVPNAIATSIGSLGPSFILVGLMPARDVVARTRLDVCVLALARVISQAVTSNGSATPNATRQGPTPRVVAVHEVTADVIQVGAGRMRPYVDVRAVKGSFSSRRTVSSIRATVGATEALVTT